jgi:hypothetical protein
MSGTSVEVGASADMFDAPEPVATRTRDVKLTVQQQRDLVELARVVRSVVTELTPASERAAERLGALRAALSPVRGLVAEMEVRHV